MAAYDTHSVKKLPEKIFNLGNMIEKKDFLLLLRINSANMEHYYLLGTELGYISYYNQR